MAETWVESLRDSGICLSAERTDELTAFLDELLRWNQRINLTAIRDRQEALEKHLIDSLLLLPELKPGSLLDMGSGAGLPGIPLAMVLPELLVTSVDSVGKKINFQKHIKRKFKLNNFRPLHGRLEELSRLIPAGERFDQVVARAFSSFAQITTLAKPWLAEAGQILIMKGPEGAAEWDEFSRLPQAELYAIKQQKTYRLPVSKAERQLFRLELQ